MAEPTIVCPKCGTEIKLTESLAAPLVAAARSELEEKIARNNSEVAKRESAIRDKEVAIIAARAAIDEQVTAKLEIQRTAIAADEAKKAQMAQEIVDPIDSQQEDSRIEWKNEAKTEVKVVISNVISAGNS